MVSKLSSINLAAECFYRGADLLNQKPFFKKKVKYLVNLDRYVVPHACNFYELPLYPLCVGQTLH